MQPQTPIESLPIAAVQAGMVVVDANGDSAGTVVAVQQPGTDVRPDVVAGLAEQLMAAGYFRIEGSGALSNDTYAGADQIKGSTPGDPGTVTLSVSWQELFRSL
jgi:hypothetical protein